MQSNFMALRPQRMNLRVVGVLVGNEECSSCRTTVWIGAVGEDFLDVLVIGRRDRVVKRQHDQLGSSSRDIRADKTQSMGRGKKEINKSKCVQER